MTNQAASQQDARWEDREKEGGVRDEERRKEGRNRRRGRPMRLLIVDANLVNDCFVNLI